jgi:hypothetical protein
MLYDVISSILFSIIDVNSLIQLLGPYNLLNPPGAIQNGQSRETDNTRRKKTHTIQYVLDTTIRKQTQIT